MVLNAIYFIMLTKAVDIATDDGQEFTISYDSEKEMIKLEAVVGADKYLGIGFGAASSMHNVDMVIF